jgi:hypothetical protein
VTGDELRRLRERRGLDRAELADATNQALGTTYSAETVARWERGSRQVSKKAGAFFQELAVSDFTDTVGGDAEPVDDLPPAGDVPPGPGPGAEPQRALTTGGGVYVKACEELWEMIAAGVGMLGAATGTWRSSTTAP